MRRVRAPLRHAEAREEPTAEAGDGDADEDDAREATLFTSTGRTALVAENEAKAMATIASIINSVRGKLLQMNDQQRMDKVARVLRTSPATVLSHGGLYVVSCVDSRVRYVHWRRHRERERQTERQSETRRMRYVCALVV